MPGTVPGTQYACPRGGSHSLGWRQDYAGSCGKSRKHSRLRLGHVREGFLEERENGSEPGGGIGVTVCVCVCVWYDVGSRGKLGRGFTRVPTGQDPIFLSS